MLQSPETSSSSVAAEEPPASPSGAAVVAEPKLAQEEPEASTQTQAANSARSDPGKMPKWLKLPGEERMYSKHTLVNLTT